MTQDSNISIPLNGPNHLTRIIRTNLNHNTEHAVHQIQNHPDSLARKSVINHNNFNLHPQQWELLLWYCRLGHADFQRVQSLLSKPNSLIGSPAKGHLYKCIVVQVDHGTSSCKPPKCEACQYAKQKRIPPIIQSIQTPPSGKVFSLLTTSKLAIASLVTSTCVLLLDDWLVHWARKTNSDNLLEELYSLTTQQTSFSVAIKQT